jgi:hypothetical protein
VFDWWGSFVPQFAGCFRADLADGQQRASGGDFSGSLPAVLFLIPLFIMISIIFF